MKRIVLSVFASILLFSSMSMQASQISSYAGKKLHQASQLQQENKLEEAIDLLEGVAFKSDYDKAFVKRFLGVYYWQAEHAFQAIDALDSAVKIEALQPEEQWKTRQMLADILFSEQKLTRALQHYKVLLSMDYPTTNDQTNAQLLKDKNDIQLRMSMAYFQQQNWSSSLSRIKQYQAKVANEILQALKIQVVCELQLEKWRDAEITLNRILRFEPNQRSWWQQLVSVQLQQEKRQSAMETYALSKHQGMDFSIDDYIAFAQLYAQYQMPEKSARVLGEMFTKYPESYNEKNITRQAHYWQLAKEWEYAINAWRVASKINPKYHWRLARLLIQQSHYQQAISIMDKAKPYADRGEYSLVKIRLLYKLNRLQDALAEAKRLSEKLPSDSASAWIYYLNSKISS